MKISLKNLFFITFSVAIVAKALDGNEIGVISGSAVLIIFSVVWGFMALIKNHGVVTCSLGLKIFSLLSLYFLIWGLINIKNLDQSDSVWLLSRSLFMVLFMASSCYWIKHFNCLKEIIKCMYVSLAIMMIVLFVLNIGEINVIKTITSFWISSENLRFRTKFGYPANNVAAEIAMSVLLFSRVINKPESNKKKIGLTGEKVVNFIVALLMVVIIVANNSRGTVMALVTMIIVSGIIKLYKRRSVQKTIWFFIIIAIIIILGITYYCLYNRMNILDLMVDMNRLHWVDNLAILEHSGRWWLGIGRISGGYFADGNTLYGLTTNYMEIYYIAVFITSGIVGSLWMVFILGLILKEIYKVARIAFSDMSKWTLLIYAYSLFISLFEDYLFNYGYVTSMCFMICIISYLELSKRQNNCITA